MRVTLSDPLVMVEGWTGDLDKAGEYTLRIHKTPDELRLEKEELKRLGLDHDDPVTGRKAKHINQYHNYARTCISHAPGRTDVAYFLPGLWPRIKQMLDEKGERYEIVDKRNPAIRPPLDYTAFQGVEFRETQDMAVALISQLDCGIIETTTGYGKCHHGDTPILMYDGSIKKARDIQIGDMLMGDDSTPRHVLSLTKGRGPMYRYKPLRGDSYIFNGSHMLSLVNCSSRAMRVGGKTYGKGDILDISIEDYLNLSQTKKHVLKGYRSSGIEFSQHAQQPLDPYFVGVYLGDGTECCGELTTPDYEILDYCRVYGEQLGWQVDVIHDNKCTGLKFKTRDQRHRRTKAPIIKIREACGILKGTKGKRIIDVYKFGTREQRLKLLAGLIDTDGYLVNDSMYEITTKWDAMAEDILFVARSVGLYAHDTYGPKKCTNTGAVGWYHRIDISGEIYNIPVKVARKKASIRKHGTDSLHVGFRLESLPEDEYYGFAVDGNHRYLLGDFTVTHNSFIISLLCKAYPTLNIVVATSSTRVVSTLYEYLCKTIPGQVGMLGAGRDTTSGKRVVCTTLKSLGNIPPEKVQLVFVDECHVVGDNLAGADLMKFKWARRFGFSASPVRNDGSARVMEALLGPTILKMTYQEAADAGMVTPMKYLMLPCNACPQVALKRGIGDFALRRWSYWRNKSRNGVIRSFVMDLKKRYDGQILIVVSTMEHAIALHLMLPWFVVAHGENFNKEKLEAAFPAEKYPSLNLEQYKLNTKQMERMQGAFAKGTLRYVIATKSWKQGVNFEHLAVVVRADGDVSDIECIQIPGRASRLDNEKEWAYLVDILDLFSPWATQRANARIEEYENQQWKQINYMEMMNGIGRTATTHDDQPAG